jgi:DNA gyrase/topoisomerase IV subunit B
MSNDDDAPASPAAEGYDCNSITVLEDIEAIRKRPAMFIGDVHDGSGLHHLVREVVDEGLVHHAAGRCHRVSVTIRRSGAVTVEDDGPGLPVDALVLFTRQFHRVSMLCCVNALSEECYVEVHRGGHAHGQHYRRGRSVTPVVPLGAAGDTGLRVTFRPDPLIFDSVTFDGRRLDAMLRPIAFLHPHLRVDLNDERPGGARKSFLGAGIEDWVDCLTEGRDGFPVEPVVLRGASDDLVMQAALRWARGSTTRVRCFANDREFEPGALLGGLATGLRLACRPAGLAPPARGRSTDLVGRGLAAILDVRGARENVRWRRFHDEAFFHGVRRLVARPFSEELARRPHVLHELCAGAG